jgi:hypothetical protein
MWIPLLLGGAIVWYFVTKSQAPAAPAPAPVATPDGTVGLTSGGAYYQGYLDQMGKALDVYNASNKNPGTDGPQLMKTLNAIMTVATNDSGWNGHLTTTDMYNLNEAYKAAVGQIV